LTAGTGLGILCAAGAPLRGAEQGLLAFRGIVLIVTARRERLDPWMRAAGNLGVIALLAAPLLYLGSRWQAGTLDLTLFAGEWGALEIVHSILTAVSAVIFYLSWRNGKGPVRAAGGALALLAAAAFVRELDVELVTKAIGWERLVWIGEHGLQEILLIAMTIPIFIYLFLQRRHFLGVVKLGLRWQAWALYVSGGLVLLCVYLDERVVHGMRMRFWEEMIETYSYIFMVIAAWRHLQLVDDEAWSRDEG
jgi:hypothetical protein